MVAGKVECLCVCVCERGAGGARQREKRGGATLPQRAGDRCPPVFFLRSSRARCSVSVHLRKLKFAIYERRCPLRICLSPLVHVSVCAFSKGNWRLARPRLIYLC